MSGLELMSPPTGNVSTRHSPFAGRRRVSVGCGCTAALDQGTAQFGAMEIGAVEIGRVLSERGVVIVGHWCLPRCGVPATERAVDPCEKLWCVRCSPGVLAPDAPQDRPCPGPHRRHRGRTTRRATSGTGVRWCRCSGGWPEGTTDELIGVLSDMGAGCVADTIRAALQQLTHTSYAGALIAGVVVLVREWRQQLGLHCADPAPVRSSRSRRRPKPDSPPVESGTDRAGHDLLPTACAASTRHNSKFPNSANPANLRDRLTPGSRRGSSPRCRSTALPPHCLWIRRAALCAGCGRTVIFGPRTLPGGRARRAGRRDPWKGSMMPGHVAG
jgi:hypothetical protein